MPESERAPVARPAADEDRTRRRRVPEDVAILGVDGDPIFCEHQQVTLSSIIHNHEHICYEAARVLEQLMSGGPRPPALTLVPPVGLTTRESTDTFAVNDPALRPAIELIQQNLEKPYGGAQLAAALGIPRVRLDRLFADTLGHSVGQEIARRRLAKAKQLLCSTDLTLSDIATQCGYCHASFFIRRFKLTTGQTPSEWRNRQS